MKDIKFKELVESIDYLVSTLVENSKKGSTSTAEYLSKESAAVFSMHLENVCFEDKKLDNIVFMIFKQKFKTLTVSEQFMILEYVKTSMKTHLNKETAIYKFLKKLEFII